jgi:hypothetical protein
MTSAETTISIKKTTRITGSLYLIIFIANMFAYFFVRARLIIPGDAAATASNIIASEGLFRLGFVSYLVVFLSDIGVSVLLYVLLKPVSKTLALLALVTRLAQTAIHGVNLLNQVFVLLLLSGADYLAGFESSQLNILAMLFLNAHEYGVLISEAFFSLHMFVLGYLIIKSEYLPKILGYFVFLASLGYVLDSFGIFLLPRYESIIAQIIIIPVVIGELFLTFWLLVKGVNTERWAKRILESN